MAWVDRLSFESAIIFSRQRRLASVSHCKLNTGPISQVRKQAGGHRGRQQLAPCVWRRPELELKPV